MDMYNKQFYDEQCKRYGTPRVLDDIVSLRAADSPSAKILAFPFPRAESKCNEYYETFTAAQLKGFIDVAVQRFMAMGYKPVSKITCRKCKRQSTIIDNAISRALGVPLGFWESPMWTTLLPCLHFLVLDTRLFCCL